MSKSNRRPKASQPERPLPERERLEIVPDFLPEVRYLVQPKAAAHYRTTFLAADAGHVAAYAEVTTGKQSACRHSFAELDRFGCAVCEWCQVHAWSAWWVADGVYGDEGTAEWIIGQREHFEARFAEQD